MLKIASLFIYADDVMFFMINPSTVPVFLFNMLPYSINNYIKMALWKEKKKFTPELNTQRCYLVASV